MKPVFPCFAGILNLSLLLTMLHLFSSYLETAGIGYANQVSMIILQMKT